MCGREGRRKDKLRVFFIATRMGVLFGKVGIKCRVKKKNQLQLLFSFLGDSVPLISDLGELPSSDTWFEDLISVVLKLSSFLPSEGHSTI